MKSLFASSILLLLLAGGCVRRQVTVTSDPPGALVYANDQEIGRTPFTRDFIWYGRYDMAIRKDGYDPLKIHTSIYAPWWEWAPVDLISDTMPLTDRHTVSYTLRPASTQPTNNQALMARAQNLQGKLQAP